MTDNGRTLREILERTDRIRDLLDGLGDAEGRYARIRTTVATLGMLVRIELPGDGD